MMNDAQGTHLGEGSPDLQATLKQRFGHNSFRPMQERIIADVLACRDVFVVMPTGGGKSLCYQLPAVVQPGVSVVISPLIALMQDQLKALEGNGISATVLNSMVASAQIADRERQAAAGRYDLVYMAPERLMSPAGQDLLSKLDIAQFVIDEAHCISEWGHDFRREYRMLGQLRQLYANVPILALTATATPRVADDIIHQLHLRDACTYRGELDRANLFYQVRPKKGVLEQILRYLNEHPVAEGIVYCLSRASTEQMAQKLQTKGIAALPYHAGLERDQRTQNQHDFVYGQTRVITATIAFGMGIDKPDVRFVFHNDLPRNIESYYQETGRAGRDGLEADCILFFSHGDRHKIERFIKEKESERERQLAYEQLQQMVNYAYATDCRCAKLLGYFGEDHAGQCGHCDNCRLPPKRSDATQDARKLLSAVARTGQRFGIQHLINVLRGADNERIKQYRHEQLSVYGIGDDQPAPYWRRLAEALVHAGQLGQTKDDYRTLHLTSSSKPVLRGEVPIEVVVPRAIHKTKPAPAVVAESVAAYDSGEPVDEQLFETLRTLRRKLADEQHVPPYVIFSDAALRQMAQRRPTTPEQFAGITGVGQYKLDRYGAAFMGAIAVHGGN